MIECTYEIITYPFLCIVVFVGGVLHRYIPLPDADHPLPPWSDTPRSLAGSGILPHSQLGQDR